MQLESGAVVGIVTRKVTGLTRQFDTLIETLDENVRVFSAARGGASWGVGNGKQVSLFPILAATQGQLRDLARELRRSANVGIGIAYQLDEVLALMRRLSTT